MKKNAVKIIAVLAVIVLAANMVLFAMGIIKEIVFWTVIIAGAVFTYWVLPKLRKK